MLHKALPSNFIKNKLEQDNEMENILVKNNKIINNTLNTNNYSNILIEYQNDYFEYSFNDENSNEKNFTFNFLRDAACSYWHIPYTQYKDYFITYNNIILSKNECVNMTYCYIHENCLSNKFELQHRSNFILNISEKNNNENKFKEKEYIEDNSSISSYFCEIELYESEIKSMDLIHDYFMEKGSLTEKLQRIKYETLSNKIRELENVIVETEETLKDLDKQEQKDFLNNYYERISNIESKNSEKRKEEFQKAYNKTDKPIIITSKDLWSLKVKHSLYLLFYFMLLGFHIVYSRVEKNQNFLSNNLLKYAQNIFYENPSFKKFLATTTIEKTQKSQIFPDKDRVYFYLNFVLNNLLFIFSQDDPNRYKAEYKLNRLMQNSPYFIYSQNNYTRLLNFIQFGEVKFKYSRKFQFRDKCKSADSDALINSSENQDKCNLTADTKMLFGSLETNEKCKSVDNNSLFQILDYYSFSEVLTRDVELCNGFSDELSEKIYEINNIISLYFNKTYFNITDNVEIGDQHYKMLSKILRKNLLNFLPNETYMPIDKNLTNNTGDNFDYLFKIYYNDTNYMNTLKGSLVDQYFKSAYYLYNDFYRGKNATYRKMIDSFVKRMLYKQDLRVLNLNVILYFKKFDIFIKLQSLFEFGAIGLTKSGNEIVIADYFKKVKLKKFLKTFNKKFRMQRILKISQRKFFCRWQIIALFFCY